MNDSLAAKVRSVIAGHFGIDANRLTDEARFRDLGADWLDRLELMIAIEDEVAGVEIDDTLQRMFACGEVITRRGVIFCRSHKLPACELRGERTSWHLVATT